MWPRPSLPPSLPPFILMGLRSLIYSDSRQVAMMGSIRVGYGTAERAEPEFNAACDPEACKAALAAPWRNVTIAPLDVSRGIIVTGVISHLWRDGHYQPMREGTGAGAFLCVGGRNGKRWKRAIAKKGEGGMREDVGEESARGRQGGRETGRISELAPKEMGWRGRDINEQRRILTRGRRALEGLRGCRGRTPRWRAERRE